MLVLFLDFHLAMQLFLLLTMVSAQSLRLVSISPKHCCVHCLTVDSPCHLPFQFGEDRLPVVFSAFTVVLFSSLNKAAEPRVQKPEPDCGVGTPACWGSPARGCRALLHSFFPGHRLFPFPSVSRILFSSLHLRNFAHIDLHACNSLPIYLNSYPTFRAQHECYI